MHKLVFSFAAISRLQAVLLIVIVLVAAVAVGFIYQNQVNQPRQPHPTPTPSFSPFPTGLPAPAPANLKINSLHLDPSEAWPEQPVNVSVAVSNVGFDSISYQLPILVNGAVAQYVDVALGGDASKTVSAILTLSVTGNFKVSAGGQSATLMVVQTGYHTLTIGINGGGSQPIPFKLNNQSLSAPYTALLPVGEYHVDMPSPYPFKTSIYTFGSWSDRVTSPSRNFTLNQRLILVASYSLTSGFGSCPSLYTWNGTSYSYASEVSDGSGWLGYLEYFKADGSMVFSNNYPWDYIKLDQTQLQPLNGYFNMKITQNSDEIFYLDQAKMVAVDHPANVDVFSTTSTFVYNLTGQGTIYTVSNPAPPVSAVNGTGQNVLPQISKMDGVYTAGTTWSWNQLTLNLGNLANAQEIKLVVGAKITWPTTQAGGNNFLKYASQPGVMPSPPPYMEIKAPNGSWVKVPDDRQFPLPDVTDNVFVVNLTGLFLSGNYELRVNTYQNIQFDYIGVDTSSEQNINVQTIMPATANFGQAFSLASNSTGAFTKYGDVNSLLQLADDKFVVGRVGDEVTLQFPVDQTPIPKGWVRDYFVFASCWFKGNGLSYVPFTVNPLPFQAMTSFPYPPNESYPYDQNHLTYLNAFNTRKV